MGRIKHNKKSQPQADDVKEVFKIHFAIDEPVVYPDELLDIITLAISLDLGTPVLLSEENISLYHVYMPEDNEFWGCFYGVKFQGRYYGNVVGRCEIISCSGTLLRFEESDELFLPIRMINDNSYFLVCRYEHSGQNIFVSDFKVKFAKSGEEKLLFHFEKDVPCEEAVDFCLALLS